MELSEGRVQYQPSLDAGAGDSFLGLVEGLLGDTEAVAASMPRLLEGALSYKVSSSQAQLPDCGRWLRVAVSPACPRALPVPSD